MRRSIATIPYRASTTSSLAAAFSTGGGGRGRGGGIPPLFPFENPTDNADPPPSGHGRGRGKPLPSSPVIPSFSKFVNNPPPSGRGRGFVLPDSNLPPPPPPQDESRRHSPKSEPHLPFLFGNEEDTQNDSAPPVQDNALSGNILDILSGAGRGKPVGQQSENRTAQNRHIRRAAPPVSDAAASDRAQLSTVEKVKRAREILSRGGEAEVGFRGQTGGGFREESGERDWGRGDDMYSESEDELEKEFINPAEIQEQIAELTKELGPEFTSVFDEQKWRLPRMLTPIELDALDENLSIECEPEFLMEVFGTNPDIDEKPPIPIRDALEKIKPYLMVYAGLQTQEEWEKYIEKAMESVPLLKEIVDHYSGPDRVTAKEQQKELQRVAKTLPARVPDSVKQFTDRALLSLQSNPGWRFDQKCKFMDKLVSEVSQHYK